MTGRIVAHVRMSGCELVDCVLDGCSFGGCTIEGCTFRGCRIASPRSQNSYLRDCDFVDCELVGVDWSLLWPDDRNGSAIGKLNPAACASAALTGWACAGSGWRQLRARLRLAACDLRDCDLHGCDLAGTRFEDCRMQRANLTGATGYRLSLLRNRVQGARFTYPIVSRSWRARVPSWRRTSPRPPQRRARGPDCLA